MGGLPENLSRTFTEEVVVAGSQLVEEVNRRLAEGNVVKLQVRSANGEIYLSLPLTPSAAGGAVVAAPWLPVLRAVAGLFSTVKLEIARLDSPAAQGLSSERAHERPQLLETQAASN